MTRAKSASDTSHSTFSGNLIPLPASSGVRAWLGQPIWRELRSIGERRALLSSPLEAGDGLPAGLGRPVLLIPGFLSRTSKIKPLARALAAAGWEVEVARLGRNAGPAYESLEIATAQLADLRKRTGQRVSIVGHSRGGQLGRILAVRHPDLVARVVAVTAPLRIKYPPYVVVKLPAEVLDWVWRLGFFGTLRPSDEKEADRDRFRPLPDEVEVVSVFSRSDGIVDWRFCAAGDCRLVEVDATHLGVMQSISGVRAIAEELARPL